MLRWFYRQRTAGTDSPLTERFATDPAAGREGSAFTLVEVYDAAEYLSAKGLIKGVNVDQARGPVRAEITPDGVDCVIDWDGDVARYLRDQRGYGPTYNGPVIHGNADGSQFAYGNQDVTQTIDNPQQVAPGFEPLAEAVSTLLVQLPTLGLTEVDQEDAQAAAAEMLEEVRRPQPSARKIRRAVAALGAFSNPSRQASPRVSRWSRRKRRKRSSSTSRPP